MVGRKEVGAKRGDEMRGLIIVSNAGDVTDCGPAKALHDGAVGIERNGRRIQETGNGGFRTGPVKAGKMVGRLSVGWDEVGEWQRCAVSAVPVPTKLLNLCVRRTHMPYSITTSDPNNFKDNGSTLHQVHWRPVVRPVERRNYQSS